VQPACKDHRVADADDEGHPPAAMTGVPTWEWIARERGRFIYTVAYRLTGNHDEAQDLVQEVLLRVQRGLATYKPGSLEGWLSRITTNVFLDDVRRKKRRPTQALPDDAERVLPGALAADDALAQAVLPDHVQAALLALPEDFRVAVVLCDVVGQSYDEIAEGLEVPIGTVRSRIHRGRLALRAALSEAGPT
jgi:RNA polymerase sigma-70 factor (ECF subfamily)